MGRLELKQMLADEKQFDNALRIIVQEVIDSFYHQARAAYGKRIDDQDIDDIFQETLIEFVKKIKLEGVGILQSTPHAYIIGIGRKKWLEFFKKKNQYSGKLTNLLQSEQYYSIEESQMETKLLDELAVELGKLGFECQKLLKLRYWDKKKYSEILTEMPGLGNENNCKQRKLYCLKQLKKIMKVN